MKKGFFSSKLAAWYEVHHRDLPWRKTRDPYKIWLSEIILQQTRVIQGLPYYLKFILHYPNIRSLASAPEQEILRLWQGLGYYSRARNLRKCAQTIIAHHGAKFPKTSSQLKALPGIGDYTAAAIASFAFQERVAVVDGNVYRVLARLFGIDKNISSSEGRNVFAALANQLMPEKNPGLHNQAMMEFGALHCLPTNPKCDSCDFEKTCHASRHGSQQWLPVKAKPKKPKRRYFYYIIARHGGKILMKERKAGDIWTGLYDFPLFEEKRADPLKIIRDKVICLLAIGREKDPDVIISKEFTHVLTHQVIRARFIEIKLPKKGSLPKDILKDCQYYSLREIIHLPKPVLISRYLQVFNIL